MSTDSSQGNQDDGGIGNQAEEQPVHPVNLLNLPESVHIPAAGDDVQAPSLTPDAKADLAPLLSLNYWTVFLKFLNVLPFAEVLRLRTLNRKTCSTIDNFLEDRLVVALKRYHNKLTLTPNDLVFNENTQKYDLLITKPIANWMNLHLTFLAIQNQRFIHFLPWLRLRGPQVYKLRSMFCMKHDNGNPVNILKNLRSVLICTEDVQMIGLEIFGNYSDPGTEKRFTNQMITCLHQNPFPRLRKLYHVSFCLDLDLFQLPTVAFTIFQQFFHAYEAQLRSMEFKVQTLDQLEVLQHSKAPLEHLDITIHPNSPITPTQVLRALKPFQSTLKELVWNHDCSFAAIHRPLGEWPLVKSLQLIVDDFQIVYYTDDRWHWLGSFPGLQHLRMGDEEECFCPFMDQVMYHSNIWIRLPNLQTLQFYESMLTRSTYEEKFANQQV